MKKKLVWISLIVLLSVSAWITYKSVTGNEFYMFAPKSSDDANLIKCLDKNRIEYKVDDNGDVHIREKDGSKAVQRCA